jgi:hypothetical protein
MKVCVRCQENNAKVWLDGVGRVHWGCMTQDERKVHQQEINRDRALRVKMKWKVAA